jgi:hypothetical protein
LEVLVVVAEFSAVLLQVVFSALLAFLTKTSILLAQQLMFLISILVLTMPQLKRRTKPHVHIKEEFAWHCEELTFMGVKPKLTWSKIKKLV